MYQLSVGAAYAYVRKCIDEMYNIDDDAMIRPSDDINLRGLVESSIVEAVVKTHNAAPTLLLEGITGTKDHYSVELSDGVVTIKMNVPTLRILSVQASDSDRVICEFLLEESPEGRKQLNKYVRGVPDDPRVVLSKIWNGDHKPIIKYYTTAGTDLENLITLSFLPYPCIEETIVEISPRLEYAVLNEITAMVLDSLNEPDRASLYRGKSTEYLKG